MNWLHEASRHAVARQIADAIAGALLATALVDAAAEPEMTFKLSGVRSSAGVAFQSEMQRARVKVREWWGATFESSISIETNTDRVLSMALIPAWRGERGQMIFGAKRVNAGEAATVHEMIRQLREPHADHAAFTEQLADRNRRAERQLQAIVSWANLDEEKDLVGKIAAGLDYYKDGWQSRAAVPSEKLASYDAELAGRNVILHVGDDHRDDGPGQ